MPSSAERVDSPPKKKSSGLAAILHGGLILVGGGVWYGLQVMNGDGVVSATATTQVSQELFPDREACPEMVLMSGGNYVLSSFDDERGRSGNKGPQVNVSIPPFWIGKTEISRAE